MSEPEFEVYLSLLSKLLHLTARQRAEITAELRDHLEERLHELEAEGHDHRTAIALALEEFGDAAVLAHDLALPHVTRRRQLMRYSLGSVAVVVATFVLAAFYWPAQRPDLSVMVNAQGRPRDDAAALAPELRDPLRQRVEEALNRTDVTIEFPEATFSDALQYLSDALEVDFVLDMRFLNDNGIDPETPITLKLRKDSATVRTVLDLMFQQLGDGSLAYSIRDGLVLITSPEAGYEVQVYNCRDLLTNVKVERASAQAQTGGGFSSGAIAGMPAGMGGGGGIGGIESFGGINSIDDPGNATSDAGQALINVIASATGDAWVQFEGDGGTISEFNGLLIVRHNQRVHRNIEDLLAKMRQKVQLGAPLLPAELRTPEAVEPQPVSTPPRKS